MPHGKTKMLKLLKYLKGYRVAAVLAPLFKIIEAIIELIIPIIVAHMIDGPIADGDVTQVIVYGIVMIALGAVGLHRKSRKRLNSFKRYAMISASNEMRLIDLC